MVSRACVDGSEYPSPPCCRTEGSFLPETFWKLLSVPLLPEAFVRWESRLPPVKLAKAEGMKNGVVRSAICPPVPPPDELGGPPFPMARLLPPGRPPPFPSPSRIPLRFLYRSNIRAAIRMSPIPATAPRTLPATVPADAEFEVGAEPESLVEVADAAESPVAALPLPSLVLPAPPKPELVE